MNKRKSIYKRSISKRKYKKKSVKKSKKKSGSKRKIDGTTRNVSFIQRDRATRPHPSGHSIRYSYEISPLSLGTPAQTPRISPNLTTQRVSRDQIPNRTVRFNTPYVSPRALQQ